MSHVLPSRSPALASENKCLINGFSDHLKRLPRTHPKVVSEQNKHTAHTHMRAARWPFAAAQDHTMASSCLFGTLREYFLKRSHFSNSRTVD